MGFGSSTKYRRRIVLIFLFLCVGLSLSAQANLELSYSSFQEYQKALKLQQTYKAPVSLSKSEHPVFDYWINGYRLSLSLLFFEDRDGLHLALDFLDNAYRQVKKQSSAEPWKSYALAENRMQKMLLEARYHQYWSAFWTFREAIALSKSAFKNYPNFSGNIKVKGTLEVLQSAIPEDYAGLASFLGMQGDYAKGMALLKSIPANDVFFTESVLLSKLLEDVLEKEKTPLKQEEKQLFIDLDENPLSLLMLVRQAMREHRDSTALRIIEQADDRVRSTIPLLHYLQAELLLRSNQWNKAYDHYQLFLRFCPTADLSKDAHFKSGLCAWAKGNEIDQEKQWEMASNIGYTHTDADRYAAYSLATRSINSLPLLKARYLIDGGYLEQALQLLEATPQETLSPFDQLEWAYRHGRLQEQKGNYTLALTSYLQAIQKCPRKNLYQGPNSCLLAAQLYASEGKNKEAFEQLKALRKFKHYPYQKSILKRADKLKKRLLQN